MKINRKQQGITMITMVFGLAVLAFFVTIIVTVFPVYMENFTVNSHLTRLSEDSRAKAMTKTELRKTLSKRFGIDDVKNVHHEDIIITGEAGEGYQIEVDYEVRQNFMGNVDLVIYFNKSIEIN